MSCAYQYPNIIRNQSQRHLFSSHSSILAIQLISISLFYRRKHCLNPTSLMINAHVNSIQRFPKVKCKLPCRMTFWRISRTFLFAFFERYVCLPFSVVNKLKVSPRQISFISNYISKPFEWLQQNNKERTIVSSSISYFPIQNQQQICTDSKMNFIAFPLADFFLYSYAKPNTSCKYSYSRRINQYIQLGFYNVFQK